MKNADGSYRSMPGFASLGRRMAGTIRGHPPATIVAGSASATTSENVVPSQAGADGAPDDRCPMKLDRDEGSPPSSSWSYFRPSTWRSGSGDGNSACPVQRQDDGPMPPQQRQQQYDVYSRPLPMDPANNMPKANLATAARNSLPSPGQEVELSTERVTSTISKEVSGGTRWTYPSPQMFYNALARKGKLDADTREEDMESVVAIHNCMNEGTWERILQWERVLCPPDDSDNDSARGRGSGPCLTKFMGRPTELSPKAFFKHYVLNHPLPFDRHDWTVTRTNPSDGSTRDVRYVIDYFHNDVDAAEEEGSGLPAMDEGIGPSGRVKSLLVDVRPAADSFGEVWGRLVEMPLARRGCRSVLECVLFKGNGSGPRSDFEPLPLAPSQSLGETLGESREVWSNIQRDAAMKKGVGAKDGGDLEELAQKEDMTSTVGRSGETVSQIASSESDEEPAITQEEAARLATSFSDILSQCQDSKKALTSCASDEDCNKAQMGFTVCAGKFLCPLQHKSLMDSLASHDNTNDMEMAEAKISMALDVLGECVANCDTRARAAKQQFAEVFEKALRK